jgi:hypothetical protein
MGFEQIYNKYEKLDIGSIFSNISSFDIKRILDGDIVDEKDFLSLLSPKAYESIEYMAEKASVLTLQNFGRTIQLYTPIYLSDYCDNRCVYCGFNKDNDIVRKKLSLEEVEKEAKIIARSGLKHILVLVGGSRKHSPVSYIKDLESSTWYSQYLNFFAHYGDKYRDVLVEKEDISAKRTEASISRPLRGNFAPHPSSNSALTESSLEIK